MVSVCDAIIKNIMANFNAFTEDVASGYERIEECLLLLFVYKIIKAKI